MLISSKKEIERRWIVVSADPTVFSFPSVGIFQGYVGPKGMRVRISELDEGAIAELFFKTGHGLVRNESHMRVPLALARLTLQLTPLIIRKRRYLRDGWEVDMMEDTLKGLVLAEFEMASADQKLELPTWILSALEVTETLTNHRLAVLARDLDRGEADPYRGLPDEVRKLITDALKK